MKQILFMIMMFVGLSGHARWSATSHHFGVIAEDSGRVECCFTLLNDSSEAIAILSARTTCGCTLSDYPRDPIAPGDSAIVTVTFDPAGRPGQFTKYINVETTGTPSKTRLAISGTVIGSEATIAQRFPVDFGALRLVHNPILIGEVSGTRIRSVYSEGYNRSSDSIRVSINKAPKWLKVNVAPSVVAPGNQLQIIFYIDPEKCPEYGLIEDSIAIAVDDQIRSINFTLNHTEDFSQLTDAQRANAPIAFIAQRRLDFGRISGGSHPQLTATIENRGNDRLIIRRVYSDSPAIKAAVKSSSLKKGKSGEIIVEVDPMLISGSILNERITIITNDPANPVQHVRIVGTL